MFLLVIMQPVGTEQLMTLLIDTVTADDIVSGSELAELLTLVPHVPKKQLESYHGFRQQVAMGKWQLDNEAKALLDGIQKYWALKIPHFYQKHIVSRDNSEQDESLAILAAYPKFIKKTKLSGNCGQTLECLKKEEKQWFLPLPTKRLQFKDRFESLDLGYALYTYATKEAGVAWLGDYARRSASESMWLYVHVDTHEQENTGFWFNVGKNCTERSVYPDMQLIHAAFLLTGLQGDIQSATLYHTHPEQSWASPGAVVVYEAQTTAPEIMSLNDLLSVGRMNVTGSYYRWPTYIDIGLVTSRGVYTAHQEDAVTEEALSFDAESVASCQEPVVTLASEKRRGDISQHMLAQAAACYTDHTHLQVTYEAF